jgi:hypothetical protein
MNINEIIGGLETPRQYSDGAGLVVAFKEVVTVLLATKSELAHKLDQLIRNGGSPLACLTFNRESSALDLQFRPLP